MEDWRKELDSIKSYPIKLIDFSAFFEEIEFNGKEMTQQHREDYIKLLNERISQNVKGIPLIRSELERYKGREDILAKISLTLDSIFLFSLITSTDYLVSAKYFLLAEEDYEKRFMRGKMYIILNEGFKKLYGFNHSMRNHSEWSKLEPIIQLFPQLIQFQYKTLSEHLNRCANNSNWWRDERNFETHLEIEKLLDTRNTELKEGEVLLKTLKLDNALRAVNEFLSNAHRYVLNYMIEKYERGELREEKNMSGIIPLSIVRILDFAF